MRRLLAALAVLFLAALGFVAVPAAAVPTGGLLVIPGDGTDIASIRLRTTAGCPQQAKNYYARMWGKGFPEAGQVITTTTSAGLRHDTGFDVYLAQTMKDFAALAGGVTLGGTYKISVYCIDKFPSQVLTEFTGSMEFTTPTAFRALGPSKPTGAPPPPLMQGGVEVPEGQGANPAAPGAGGPAAGQGEPAQAQASANAVPSESNTNLILLVGLAVGLGAASWVVLAILRRRRSVALETVSATSKGSHD
jgi:hypothetical protein